MENAVVLQRERATALDAARGQLESRRQRLADLSDSQRAMQASLHQLQEAAVAAESEWRTAIEAMQPLERDLAGFEAELTELDARKREAERMLRETESRMNAAELELARHNDELENLRQRAAELDAAEDADRPIEVQPGDDSGAADASLTAAAANDGAVPTSIARPSTRLLETLPVVDELPGGLEERIIQLRGQIRRLGAINYEAQTEYDELKRRSDFITEQSEDLEMASTALQQVIAELNDVMKDTFRQTFDAIATAFQGTFKMLFGGGQAKLTLINPENIDECGVEIQAQPPGKRPQSLALLSGGERSLTATALLFAILQVKPTPFCVLDEVDAALDESNVGRFRSMVEGLSGETQFIIITHNRETVQAAQVVYGISMGQDSASRVIGLKLEEAAKAVAER
jgi:chromosome segregation protein